jgi:hypothetical protein
VFDAGIAMVILAAVVDWSAEHSLRAAWPAPLTICGFFAVLGLQTIGLPDCPSFVQFPPGGNACLADPNSRPNTWLALVGLTVGVVLGALELRHNRVRLR